MIMISIPTEVQTKKEKSKKHFEDASVRMEEQMKQQNRGMGHVTDCMSMLTVFM